GAFDEAVKGVQAIAHTASPFHFQAEDPAGTHSFEGVCSDSRALAVLIDPAVKGTVGMLKSVLKNGSVTFVRPITSSSALTGCI
ncbi:unnamed protein product, partial [Mycena citricolor]